MASNAIIISHTKVQRVNGKAGIENITDKVPNKTVVEQPKQ